MPKPARSRVRLSFPFRTSAYSRRFISTLERVSRATLSYDYPHQYAFALCLGMKTNPSGTGPSSISLILTQSADRGDAMSVSRSSRPTYLRYCGSGSSHMRTDVWVWSIARRKHAQSQ